MITPFITKLEIGATYGFAVDVANRSDSASRWIHLGYSRKPPFPVFYDRNILVPAKSTETHRFVFTTTEKWGKDYWGRVGMRNGDAMLTVHPHPLEQLYESQFITDTLTLPQADALSLELSNEPESLFQFRYDVLGEDGKVLMADCHDQTDISVVAMLDIETVKIRVRIHSNQPDIAIAASDLRWRMR